jgi:hypothetical protein
MIMTHLKLHHIFYQSHRLMLNLFVGIAGLSLLIGLTGCQAGPQQGPLSKAAIPLHEEQKQPLAIPQTNLKNPFESRLKTTSSMEGASPFGVYDIQSGHGQGKWRSAADKMVR